MLRHSLKTGPIVCWIPAVLIFIIVWSSSVGVTPYKYDTKNDRSTYNDQSIYKTSHII